MDLLVVSKDKFSYSFKRENYTADLVNNQQGIPYGTGLKRESMSFSRMI